MQDGDGHLIRGAVKQARCGAQPTVSEKSRKYDQRFTKGATHIGMYLQLPPLILGKEAWY